jgi:hypothetical protein
MQSKMMKNDKLSDLAEKQLYPSDFDFQALESFDSRSLQRAVARFTHSVSFRALENQTEMGIVAYNAKNIEDFVACYHSEVVVRRLGTGVVMMNGIEEFKKCYDKLFKENPQLNCLLKSRIVTNEHVIDEELVTGRGLDAEALHAVAIYGLRDGLIDRVWFL